jgi:hypothetical protein
MKKMNINMLNVLELMHEMVHLMERKENLQDFKQWASLAPNTTKEEVAIFLLEESLRIEWEQRKLIMKAMRTKPDTLNVIFGEVAQSFDKSIFANLSNVNNKNSFINSRHMRFLKPDHMNEDSIPERLCSEYGTLVLDIYFIPIPTFILSELKSDMRKSGLTERILALQIDHINEVIRMLNPSKVRFICRYKSLIPDAAYIVDRILRSSNVPIEFDTTQALSGYRGMLDLTKWSNFMNTWSNLN